MFALRALPVLVSLAMTPPLTAALNAADENPAEKQVELKKGDRIIFFGDSLTALAGDEKPKEHVRQAFVAHWKANNPDNKPGGILTYDGNHFNDAGHRFVAEQMLKMFK